MDSPFASWCVIYDYDSEVHFHYIQASTNGMKLLTAPRVQSEGKDDFNARSSTVVHNPTAAERLANFLTEDIVDCVATDRYFDFR